jgi:hypothetical protein
MSVFQMLSEGNTQHVVPGGDEARTGAAGETSTLAPTTKLHSKAFCLARSLT